MGNMKRKILVLNYEFPPLGGGAATATYNLLKELSKEKDISVTLLTSAVGEYKEEKFSDNVGIYYLDIGKNDNLHIQSKKDLLKYSIKAYVWLLKNKDKYDLIHSFFGIPCGFLAMLTGKPYIVSLRGSDVPSYSQKYKILDKYVFQYLSKLIWEKAKYVVANSEGLRDLAYNTYKGKEIGVIYNGVDIDMFKPRKREESFVVVSTSRLIERKGIEYLIEGFSKFSKNKKDIELRIYGDGDLRNRLESMTKELGIEDRVKFYGETSREELSKVIPKCSVFVLPSNNEGMSNSLLEAMACGLPIIATDVGGSKELVSKRNGFVIGKENSGDICDTLNRLYMDRKLLENMGIESKKKAEGMSWNRMENEYVKLYRRI